MCLDHHQLMEATARCCSGNKYRSLCDKPSARPQMRHVVSCSQAREALDKGEKFTYTVTEQLISDALGDLLKKKDLSKYIL